MNTPIQKKIHEIQREIVYEQLKNDSEFSYTIFNGRTAIESQRKSNYKTTARAAREIIDNAIEAGGSGTNVHVVFEEWGSDAPRGTKSTTIRRVYFYDDGPGMFHDKEEASMIRFALTWGGGINHDRKDAEIGKFGFGLPNASISQCRKTSVYSREEGKDWHVGILDIDDMPEFGKIDIPPVQKASLPVFIEKWAKKNKIDTDSGTCVVWDNCDGLSSATVSKLKEDLVFDFSMTYRKYLDYLSIYVNSLNPIEKIDPLFLDPDAKYYVEPSEIVNDDPTSGGSRLMFDKTIDVKFWKDRNTSIKNISEIPDSNAMEDAIKQRLDPHGDMEDVAIGTIQIKVCRLPLGFAEKKKDLWQDEFSGQRLSILSHQTGYHFMRHGREIDVSDCAPRNSRDVASGLGSWKMFQSYARNHPVEFTFSPSLDEAFGVSNDKQSVAPIPGFWKLMSHLEVDKAISAENQWQTKNRSLRELSIKNSEINLKPAINAIKMMKSSAVKPRRPLNNSKQITKLLDEEATRVSKEERINFASARTQVIEDLNNKPIDISYKNIPGGDFMMPEYGPNLTVRLNINKAHEFYTEIFSPAAQKVKNGLLIILEFLATQELETGLQPDSKEALTLKMQRQELGRHLAHSLRSVANDTYNPADEDLEEFVD